MAENGSQQAKRHIPDIVIITGMSGSGKTQALHAFEDMGYFCIDNLPPSLILQLAHLVGINTGVNRHLVVACDLRSQGLFDELKSTLKDLTDHELTYSILFLDCSDEVLICRFKENRRRHPIALPGESPRHSIERERKQLAPIKAISDLVIDTSHMRTSLLKSTLQANYSELSEQQLMDVRVFSFGYKYGLSPESDLMIDVRFLPNPFYDPKMRYQTGLDKDVRDYVMDNPKTKQFMQAWEQLLDVVMPGYVKEGKPQLSIGIGCTGGQHRSVAIAEATAHYLKGKGYQVSITHRDLPRANTVKPA
ncbi:RNase adapter RapZ [Atopobium sp. oral taxon 416]|uniref:RNase adapter RapZ n=1 Tax=Atopobium sp. oral taxon 416 TaxID=712157 RepID=UPI0021136A37|nr:RNase adapter RapZ [Atopobium sp. oral taxon 416]